MKRVLEEVKNFADKIIVAFVEQQAVIK